MKNYKILTNKMREIDERSVRVSFKFKILFWVLNTFFRDWTIIKDIIVADNKITTKNLGPVFGSNIFLKAEILNITDEKGFKEELKKTV